MSPHLNSANDIAEKIAKNIRWKRAEAQTDNRQFEWLLPWKSGESIFHKCHSPLSCCVLCILYIFYLSSHPLPPCTELIFVECEFTASNSSLFYSFSDFAMVNTQVDVFNFEMNVYCAFPFRFQWCTSFASVCTMPLHLLFRRDLIGNIQLLFLFDCFSKVDLGPVQLDRDYCSMWKIILLASYLYDTVDLL